MTIINMLTWFYNCIKGSNFDVILPDSEFWNLFSNIMGFMGLVIPMNTIVTILSITIALVIVRFLISVLKTIWAVLPML